MRLIFMMELIASPFYFFIAIFAFHFSFDRNLFYLLNIIILSILFILNLKNMLFLGDSGIYLLDFRVKF